MRIILKMLQQPSTPSKVLPATWGFDDMFALAKKMESQAKTGSLKNFDSYVLELETQVKGLTTN